MTEEGNPVQLGPERCTLWLPECGAVSAGPDAEQGEDRLEGGEHQQQL